MLRNGGNRVAVNNFYKIDKNKLEIVKYCKRSVTFDDELRCKEHIYCKVKKANAQAGMLRKSFTGFAKVMYKQLFCGNC